MHTPHRRRAVQDSKTPPAQIHDSPADGPPRKRANGQDGTDHESLGLEQLSRSLANVSADDRQTLLTYFDRITRFVAAAKFDGTDPE
jgi:hypothetical protein